MHFKEYSNGRVAVKVATCDITDGKPTLYIYEDSKSMLRNLF